MRGELVPGVWQHDPALYAPARYRRACSYQAFVPHLLIDDLPPVSQEVAGVISDAEAALHGLNARARPALAPLARLLLRTESVASSKVEGMQVDARDLARAEARLETGGRAGAQSAEILANVDAMELAVEDAATADQVTSADLSRIHAVLMSAAPNASVAGRIRTEQNWIGGNDYNPCGAAFVPPPPDRVPALLTDLGDFLQTQHLPPLVQAAVAHAQFELIHPFTDGNGRTGRALVHVLLRRRGLTPFYVPPISAVLAGRRERYISGLESFRDGDVDGWLSVFGAAAAQAATLAESYLDAVQALQESWRDQLRSTVNPRADAAAWRVIDTLPAHPVISLPVAVTATGRTRAAVNQSLTHLESAGVLVRLGAGARNRTWEAAGLLDLLATLEQASPG